MYILFDIGGSNMRIAASNNLEHFDEPHILSTPKSFEDGVELFVDTAKKLVGDKELKGIAGGIAGPLNEEKSKIVNAPNIQEWNDKPLKKELREQLGAPVHLENDTAMIGLGELYNGAAKDFKEAGVAAYITVSTGIGGCRFVNGRIDTSAFGFEPGHQIIDADSSICPDCSCGNCGHSGHLEAYASGTAVEQQYNKKPYEILDSAIWDETAKILSYGLNNIVVLWSPNVIILGGSMMKDPGIKIENVRKHLKDTVKIFTKPPKVEKAQLGDLGGLYGAMEYLK